MSYPNYGAGQNAPPNYSPYMGQQPNPGYPPTQYQFSGYDNSSSLPYSSQPTGMPGVIGFNLGMPNQNAYPNTQQSSYPQGYPPQQQGGYPPQQPGYPPQQPGYPPQQPGYPPQQPGGYPPPQPGYPPQQQGGYPPQQQGGYPPQQQPGYPPQQQGAYPPPQQQGACPPPQQQGAYPSATQTSYSPKPQQQTGASSMHGVSSGPKLPKEQGTLKPYPGFNAESDAQILRKAMKGFGTDEKAIIDVLGNRSNSQRQDIVKMFKTIFGKDLMKELKSELSGKFEDVVLGLLLVPAMYDANELRKAMQGAGTDEEVLIEIMCSRTNKEIMEISNCFKQITGKTLENWLKSETSGHFCRLLVSLSTGGRSENLNVDLQKAEMDAKKLYEAGEKRWGTDESQFNVILVLQSPAQLRAVFDAYKRLYNREIQQAIANEMSGDLKSGMLSIVKVVQNRPSYFAERLYKSMKGAGTNDSTLIRVIISRCEIDMIQIKQEFQKMYGKTLDDFIRGDCSGDYRRILLRLIGHDS